MGLLYIFRMIKKGGLLEERVVGYCCYRDQELVEGRKTI